MWYYLLSFKNGLWKGCWKVTGWSFFMVTFYLLRGFTYYIWKMRYYKLAGILCANIYILNILLVHWIFFDLIENIFNFSLSFYFLQLCLQCEMLKRKFHYNSLYLRCDGFHYCSFCCVFISPLGNCKSFAFSLLLWKMYSWSSRSYTMMFNSFFF